MMRAIRPIHLLTQHNNTSNPQWACLEQKVYLGNLAHFIVLCGYGPGFKDATAGRALPSLSKRAKGPHSSPLNQKAGLNI